MTKNKEGKYGKEMEGLSIGSLLFQLQGNGRATGRSSSL
jgi:hypothetical protein